MQGEDKPWAPDLRNLTIDNLCDTIGGEEKLPELDAGVMGARITKEEVLASLQASASAKAPGLDGIPYELWEALHISFEATPEDKRAARGFDIITTLTKVFSNIEDNGVGEGTDFAEVWMCPIYNKI